MQIMLKSTGHVSGLALYKVRQSPGVPVGQGYNSTEMQGGRRNRYTKEWSEKTTLKEEQKRGYSMGPEDKAYLGHTCPMYRCLVGEKQRYSQG